MIGILWLGSWIAIAGGLTKLQDWTGHKLVVAAADHGYVLENLLIKGRNHTSAETILALLNIQKGDPLFALNPHEAKEMLERLSWVKTAHVERRLPDTIYVEIEERTPLALWQQNQKLTLIDENGVKITANKLARFKDLIIITGDNAPEAAAQFIALLEAEPVIEQRVESASFISNRRWDVHLDDGTVIKLPEQDTALALRRLVVSAEEGLLDKPLKTVDLRNADSITVQTIPGAVKHFKAAYSGKDGEI